MLTTPPLGEWQQVTRKVSHWTRTPTAKELRARFRGSCRPGRIRGKLSPKQSAKRRWKRQRSKRMISLLLYREHVRTSPLLRLLKTLSNDEPQTFNWYERTAEKR